VFSAGETPRQAQSRCPNARARDSTFCRESLRATLRFWLPESAQRHRERQIKSVFGVEARPALGVHDPVAFASGSGLGAVSLYQLGLKPGEQHNVSSLAHQGRGLIVDLKLVAIIGGWKLRILKTLDLRVPELKGHASFH
jgi:hypothetical protein